MFEGESAEMMGGRADPHQRQQKFGMQPHFEDEIWKTTLIFLKMEDNLIFNTEDDLNFDLVDLGS